MSGKHPDYCPHCGVAYEPLQEYCLECGARLPTNRGVVGVLASSWQRRFAWYPGDWIWPVLLFLFLTIIATGAALAANAARESSAPTLVATGPTVTVGPGAAPATVAPTTTSTLPVPSIPPAAFAGPLMSDSCWCRMLASVTGRIFTSRMYWNVQPVSSYGDGFCTG